MRKHSFVLILTNWIRFLSACRLFVPSRSYRLLEYLSRVNHALAFQINRHIIPIKILFFHKDSISYFSVFIKQVFLRSSPILLRVLLITIRMISLIIWLIKVISRWIEHSLHLASSIKMDLLRPSGISPLSYVSFIIFDYIIHFEIILNFSLSITISSSSVALSLFILASYDLTSDCDTTDPFIFLCIVRFNLLSSVNSSSM